MPDNGGGLKVLPKRVQMKNVTPATAVGEVAAWDWKRRPLHYSGVNLMVHLNEEQREHHKAPKEKPHLLFRV